MRTHAQQEQRILGLRSSGPGGVPKGNSASTACWAIEDAIAFNTCDAVHYTPFLWFAGTGPLRCTSSCHSVLMRQKVTWMSRGANALWDRLGQSTDIEGSHRSTGLMVMWTLPIRLQASVLLYELLGVFISLEALRHKVLFLSVSHSY